jgi:SWI/SNF-related matrix-associated actin-dependent regulator 1 of chromatin subfamily A
VPGLLTRDGDVLHVTLAGVRGPDFMKSKDLIKDIPGRRWNNDKKVWELPAEVETAQRVITAIKPQVADDVMEWVRESRSEVQEQLTTPLPDDGKLVIPWANKRMPWQPEVVNDEKFNGLFPYQRAAVELLARQRNAILADDMGLGKTIQALSAVEEYVLRNGQPQGPKLVIAPNSVKGGWLREIRRWLPPDTPALVVNGANAEKRREQLQEMIDACGWAIVNWEMLRTTKKKRTIKRRNGSTSTKMEEVMKEPLLAETEWLAVIADEVHRAKNRKALQTKGLHKTKGKVMLGLSGTPLMNAPDELWSILRWLFPEQYHEGGRNGTTAYWKFYTMYCDFYEGSFGKVITGVKNPDALRFELGGRLVRRTSEILGLKGRKRIYYDLPLNAKQQKLYDKAEDELLLEIEQAVKEGDPNAARFAAAIAEGKDATALYKIPNGASRMVRLQQIIETPALLGAEDDSALMDDCVEKISDSRPNQWVVATKFKESANILADRLRNPPPGSGRPKLEVGVYTGDTHPDDRTKMEDEFQAGNIDVMIGTVGAMKEGITLTKSHLVYIATESFVPAEQDQCEDRSNRKGQLHFVRVYIARPTGTVAESKVKPIIEVKRKIVKTITPVHDVQEDNA